MAVRSSGGWAFAPARPHQREGRSHPFCISPLLCLINWVPNTPAEYIMCPPHTPHPPPHLPPNLIALALLLFPPYSFLLFRLSSSQTLSHSHSTQPLSISVCSGNLQNTLAYTLAFQTSKGRGGRRAGGGEDQKKKKKYEKQFNNNNDADDKINYAQGWRMRGKKKKRRMPQQHSLT